MQHPFTLATQRNLLTGAKLGLFHVELTPAPGQLWDVYRHNSNGVTWPVARSVTTDVLKLMFSSDEGLVKGINMHTAVGEAYCPDMDHMVTAAGHGLWDTDE